MILHARRCIVSTVQRGTNDCRIRSMLLAKLYQQMHRYNTYNLYHLFSDEERRIITLRSPETKLRPYQVVYYSTGTEG
jgi:hypothetical protein